jgi:hypothetical protein
MVDDSHVEDRLVMFCMDQKKIPGNTQTLRGYLRAWKERLGGWGKLEDALWCVKNGMTVIEIQNKLFPMERAKTPAAPEFKGGCALCDGKRVMPVGISKGSWEYAPCSCTRRHGPRVQVDRSKHPLPWQRLLEGPQSAQDGVL